MLRTARRGATYRLDPARVSGPCRRFRRVAPATHPHRVLRVLSPGSHSPVARPGCTGRTADRATGARRDHPGSRSWWPASPLRSARGVVQHRSSTPPARATASSLWPSSVPPRIFLSAGNVDIGRARTLRGLVPVAIVFSLSDEQGRPSSEADPVLAKDRFLPSVDAQTQLTIRLNRGAVGPVGGEVIGEFRIEGCPPGPRRTSSVALTITAVGHDLTLTARDISSEAACRIVPVPTR